MKTRKGEQPLVMMKMKVMIRVIVVVTVVAVMVDMVMMIATPIVMTIATEVMIARTVQMIGMNPLVKRKMKTQTYSMRNMTVMWTTIIKIFKMILKLTGGAILIVINTS